ncbi:glycosylhydrolase-like jelly roll fold domain-containing protein [uncultured Capnocytophaga sp.]|nr:glycosylhydrolase-like jelly roll fold domain-containing protein [uncultured Capnocytophaga sp.]
MPLTSKVLYNPSVAKAVATPEKWHIQAGTIKVENTTLFDWKTHPQLKYNSAPAVYTTEFVINSLSPSKRYYLSLGKVYYAADVVVNGKKVSSEVFMPFVTDITPYLQQGNNTLEITITNAAYNDFVGQAEKGEKVFKKLKGSDTMSAGLIGPVQIMEQ